MTKSVSAYKVKLVDVRAIALIHSLFYQKIMEIATEQLTVQDLIEDLYILPADAPILLRDADGKIFSIAGFEVGSDGVVIIVNEE